MNIGLKKQKGIQGIIVSKKLDGNGNVIGVGIRTLNEEEFLVELSRTGQELNSHINAEVIAQGTFRERLDGKTLIRISEYQLISSSNKP